jgi:hypothetical protein
MACSHHGDGVDARAGQYVAVVELQTCVAAAGAIVRAYVDGPGLQNGKRTRHLGGERKAVSERGQAGGGSCNAWHCPRGW